MKKALLLVSVLFISVVSTACINKFAVQELNNKAKGYIEQGDYQNAIERLKSSMDLDDTVFETHYNLAVAYTQAEDYPNAISSYKKAIDLNPDFADSYYSLAVAEEDYSIDLVRGVLQLDEEGKPYKVEEDQIGLKITPESEKMINELLTDAIKNYNIYVEKNSASDDIEEVKAKIKKLSEDEHLAKDAPTEEDAR